jgi:hypothetical protein
VQICGWCAGEDGMGFYFRHLRSSSSNCLRS